MADELTRPNGSAPEHPRLPAEGELTDEQLAQVAGGHGYVLTYVSHSSSDLERQQ